MTATRQERQAARLVLADGQVFEGEAAGLVQPVSVGEVVFNTALSGYQEVITDPSYAGQVIAFTYPHIGNYGTNPGDDEAARPYCRGVVVRDLTVEPSNWQATEGRLFLTEIRVEAKNRVGLLAAVSSSISSTGTNISSVRFEQHESETVTINFVLEVRDRDHLSRAVRVVRRMSDVLKVVRTIAGQSRKRSER